MLLAVFTLAACSGDSDPSNRTVYTLDSAASEVMETINNIANLTVVSKDANDLKAEYRAGFVQGKLQGKTIVSARDNSWDHGPLFHEAVRGSGYLGRKHRFLDAVLMFSLTVPLRVNL